MQPCHSADIFPKQPDAHSLCVESMFQQNLEVECSASLSITYAKMYSGPLQDITTVRIYPHDM